MSDTFYKYVYKHFCVYTIWFHYKWTWHSVNKLTNEYLMLFNAECDEEKKKTCNCIENDISQ